MRLFILTFSLLAIVSCGPGARTTNNNSGVLSASAFEKGAGVEIKAKEPCLNLNTAPAEDLIKLPGIGEVMAKKIIDYREGHGRFRRPEEIIIIEGFSERKYRAIASMVCVE